MKDISQIKAIQNWINSAGLRCLDIVFFLMDMWMCEREIDEWSGISKETTKLLPTKRGGHSYMS